MTLTHTGAGERSNQYPIPPTMKAWVLGVPEELTLVDKPVPEPGPAEVLVRIDAVAVCATDIEILKHGLPASLDGELPFNKNFTPGHEYMGTVVKLGPTVDEFTLATASLSRFTPGAGAANAAAKACTRPASIMVSPRRVTAPMTSAPMAGLPNMR
jgi:L-iditol 2-dehydrogenase